MPTFPLVLSTTSLPPGVAEQALYAGLRLRSEPMIRLRPNPDNTQLLQHLAQHQRPYAWVFTSRFAARRAWELFYDTPPELRPQRLIAVGPQTARTLRGLGLPVDTPTEEGGAALGAHLAQQQGAGPLLHWRGSKARPELAEALADSPHTLEDLEVYATDLTPHPLDLAGVRAVLFASPSAAEAYQQSLEQSQQAEAQAAPLLAIGDTTAEALHQYFPQADIRRAIRPNLRDLLELAAQTTREM